MNEARKRSDETYWLTFRRNKGAFASRTYLQQAHGGGMNSRTICRLLMTWVVLTALGYGPNIVRAAESDTGVTTNSAALDEIVVTARKRTETLLDAPIAITAVSKEALERYAISDYQSLSNQVPGLIVNAGANAVGATVTLRGITTGDYDASFSQAVSTAIDGVQLSKGISMQEGLFDMQQVEVLEGPQTLFYGKNSPGGVINITTMDPTDHLSGFMRVQDEFEGQDKLVSAAVSGPLAEGLSARLAVQGRWFEGYNTNEIVANPAPFGVLPDGTHAPNGDEQIARLTLKYSNGSNFNVRTKIQVYNLLDSGRQETAQLYACPASNPYNFFLGNLSCSPGNHVALTQISAASITAAGLPASDFFGPHQFSAIRSVLGSVQVDYHFLDDRLALTSVSAYYNTSNRDQLDASYSGLIASLPSANADNYGSYSEELRLQSNFGGYFDFLTGVLYQHEREHTYTADALTLTPFFGFPFAVPIPPFVHEFHTDTYSGFAQAQFHITKQIDLSFGERWTEEKKMADQLDSNSTPCPGLPKDSCTQLGLRAVFHNLSPDVTLSWKPDERLNVYASYKEGFKSGGFAASVFTAPSLSDLVYKPEKTQGFEVGAKALLLNGALSFNIDAFRYNYNDLQVSFHAPGSTEIIITNAPAARTQGVEMQMAWKPGFVQGLTFRGAVDYTDAKYLDYHSTCYAAQTIAQGCVPEGGGLSTQNLNGKQMIDAPAWTGTLGVEFHAPLGTTRFNYGLSIDALFSSRYQSYSLYDPRAEQASSTKLNASARVYDGNWSVALIGTNLTSALRATESDVTTFSTIVGAGHPADLFGWFNPPRQITLQVTRSF